MAATPNAQLRTTIGAKKQQWQLDWRGQLRLGGASLAMF
jgi:hypothetical protein